MGTGIRFGCRKDGHKVRYCPTRDGKQVSPNVPKVEATSKRRFYTLQTRGEKMDYDDDDGNFFLLLEYEFLLFRGVS